ncbi:hypothetical protein Sme01_47240 [Sphaerisporangium melleum]|uniref:Uncharacterized protein n=2 Tax=Sphaerisporangium melleum TaxID=321316 RepID=A0A917VPW4_9ACTN|nr:hypothetical protein GCM10007964_50660 [Sphaerisporangium melleum]GII72248.1 hypothetical protein Sme01_47240 [Sphaerisporangium melleum]
MRRPRPRGRRHRDQSGRQATQQDPDRKGGTHMSTDQYAAAPPEPVLDAAPHDTPAPAATGGAAPSALIVLGDLQAPACTDGLCQ